jgi:sulfur-oxidizing protein SoxB
MDMSTLIEKIRAPYEQRLGEQLAVCESLLYRRGNFNGTFDQVILDALMEVSGAEIAFSPGFRWGTSVLPGDPITFEQVMNQTAITYPYTTLTQMSGETIKSVLEDICDNLFNADPYLQQGGDMVRVGGLQYTCDPTREIGSRISNMTLHGKLLDATKTYKVAGWAPIAEGAGGKPAWEVLSEYLRAKKVLNAPRPNLPMLSGVDGNAGLG